MTTLIVTNGDIAAAKLAAARPEADVLAWNDVLNHGPVPAGLDDNALRRVRAGVLAGFARPGRDVEGELAVRDATLAAAGDFDRIELWFEHDLLDQLQLVQVIERLARLGRDRDVFHLPIDRHLGPLPDRVFSELGPHFVPLPAGAFDAAAEAWTAFRAPDPTAMAVIAEGTPSGLPHLARAFGRALEELPGTADGLTRTERQALYSIGRGVDRIGFLFARVLAMEEAAFLGDLGFFGIVSDLAFARPPLLTGLPERFEPAVVADDDRRKAFLGARVRLTDAGRDVLSGSADRIPLVGIDTWVGGTHVTTGRAWRCDTDTGRLVAPGGDA
jgi:hypothetical protein